MKPGAPAAGTPDSPPSPEQFREAVRHCLVHQSGMPELAADAVLDSESLFLEQRRLACRNGENTVLGAADEIAMRASESVRWVHLQDGDRVATESQVVIDVDGSLAPYLDRLLELGLHGATRDAIVATMLARGIESVYPMLSAPQPARRR